MTLHSALQLAKKADFVLAFFSALTAAYLYFTADIRYALLAGLAAIVSGLSAKYQPYKWVAKRILLARC